MSPPPFMHLLIEHVHQLRGVLGTERLEQLGPDRLWRCVRRRNNRHDTFVVGPGDAVRPLLRGETEKTETAELLPSGLLAVGLRREVRLYDLDTFAPRGVLPCGETVYHLRPLVCRATVALARAGRMPWLLLDFLLVSAGVYLLLSSANSIMFFQQGWHFIVLFGGLAYGYRWQSIGARSLP